MQASNRVSKDQAVRFIQNAMRNGARREVENFLRGIVCVTLSRESGPNWAVVIVSFRKSLLSHRWAISFRTLKGFRGSPVTAKAEAGFEAARYAFGSFLAN